MKRLGTATAHSEDDGVVVEAEFAPDEGAKVVDTKMNAVGTVDDVFGSVDRPFVTVTDEDGEEFVGETLYVL